MKCNEDQEGSLIAFTSNSYCMSLSLSMFFWFLLIAKPDCVRHLESRFPFFKFLPFGGCQSHFHPWFLAHNLPHFHPVDVESFFRRFTEDLIFSMKTALYPPCITINIQYYPFITSHYVSLWSPHNSYHTPNFCCLNSPFTSPSYTIHYQYPSIISETFPSTHLHHLESSKVNPFPQMGIISIQYWDMTYPCSKKQGNHGNHGILYYHIQSSIIIYYHL